MYAQLALTGRSHGYLFFGFQFRKLYGTTTRSMPGMEGWRPGNAMPSQKGKTGMPSGNFNAILKICLRMVEKHPEKLSKKGKMISASLNDTFREQIIGYF